MARSIYVPQAGGFVDFKDGTSDADIVTYLKAKYPAPVQQAAPPPEAPQQDAPGAFGAGVYSGLAALEATGGAAAQGLGIDSLSKYLFDASRANQEYADRYKPEVSDISQVGGIGDLASYAGSTIAQSLPETAVGVGGSMLAGAAAGSPGGPVGVVIGLVGGAIASLPFFIGHNMQRQAQEQGKSLEDTNALSATGAAIVQSPLDAAFDVLVANKLGGLRFAEDFAKKSFLRGIAVAATEGAAAESLTEPAQQALELAQANPAKLLEFGPDVQNELLNAAAGGALAGAGLGGGASAVGRVTNKMFTDPKEQLRQDLENEKRQNAPLALNEFVVAGSEDLRQNNVEGGVEIVPEDNDGETVYRIKTPSGAYGNFLNPQMAEAAVNLYQKRTGANIKVKPSIAAPKVFPVKIAGKVYGSIDAIREAHASAVSKQDMLAEFATNPEKIKAEAASQGIPEPMFQRNAFNEFTKQGRIVKALSAYLPETQTKVLGEEEVPQPNVSEPLKPMPSEFKETPKPSVNASPEAVIPEEFAPDPIEEITPEEAAAPLTEEDVQPTEDQAYEPPVEEQRFIDEEPVTPVTEPGPEPVKQTRPSATTEQLADLQVELFGAPINIRQMTDEQRAMYEAERDKRFPPEEVDTFYKASPTDQKPRSISQAAAKAAARPYTKEYEAFRKDLYDRLIPRLREIAPAEVGLKLKDFITNRPGAVVKGMEAFVGNDSVIELALGHFRPDATIDEMVKDLVGTLNHEAIHVFRTQGLLRPAEWKILSRAVENTNVPGKKYTYLDKAQAVYTEERMGPLYADPENVREEAVAELYKDWVNGKNVPHQTRGLLNRITEFIRRIFRAIKSSNYERVFKQIESGDIKSRELNPSARADGRYAAAIYNPKTSKSEWETEGAPPPAINSVNKTGGSPYRISQRRPTTVDELGQSLTDNLIINVAAMKQNMPQYVHNVGILKSYPMMRPIKGEDADQTLKRFKQSVIQNLLWLHDQMKPEIRVRAKRWYDGARNVATGLAKHYNIPDTSAAAVIAALSPQMDWFKNVSLAERLIEIVATKQNHRFDDKMMQAALGRPAMDSYRPILRMMAGRKLKDMKDFTAADYRAARGNGRANNAVTEKDVERANKLAQAIFVRFYDEAYNPRSYHILTPEGGKGALATNDDGRPSEIGWGSFDMISKGISAFRDPSKENIDEVLGDQHKIRNFYNNILSPNSKDGSVTIDTHAVAAAQLRPLSGSSDEVHHNFGTSEKHVLLKTANSGVTGVQGLYAIYADAYREAAAQRGVLPREMQSITWEAVRGLYKATFKAQARNRTAINDIWAQYKDGKISANEARKRILQFADPGSKGINTPFWVGESDSIVYAVNGPSANRRAVLPNGVRQAAGKSGSGRDSGNPKRTAGRFSAAPVFYSSVSRAVDGAKQEKASGDQWLGTIRNAPGVKPEELDWLQLEEFLAGPRSVTRQQILDYIRANEIQIEEWSLAKDKFQPKNEAQRKLWDRIREIERKYDADPDSLTDEEISEWREGGEKLGLNEENRPDDYTSMVLPGASLNYGELLLKVPNLDGEFEHSHWPGHKNIIAHIRYDERYGAGKRILFINEMQSDLHQKGRKKGYRNSSEVRAIHDAHNALINKLKEERQYLLDKISNAKTRQEADPFEVRLYALNARMSDVAAEFYALTQGENAPVPDAPFKTSWEELALKRMVRLAADEGFDAIAWPSTPDQIAVIEGWGKNALKKVGDNKYELYGDDVTPIINRYLVDLPRAANKFYKKFNTRTVREFDGSGNDVNVLPIPPEMKTSVQQGQSRFSAAPALDSDEFKRWFRNSKIVNEDGTPKVVYHGTKAYQRFKKFDTTLGEAGSHFGTKEQANDFVSNVPADPDEDPYSVNDRIYPVYLSIQNPLRLRDMGKWTTGRMVRYLSAKGIVDEVQANRLENMPLNAPETIRAIHDVMKAAGYDGIVYLNRTEGMPSPPFGTDRTDLTDEDFKAKYPAAEDSYIVFDPVQVKSVFNQFEEGAAKDERFSAVPLPANIEAANDTLFAPVPKGNFVDTVFNFFSGTRPVAKTLRTIYGDVDISTIQRGLISGRASLVDKGAFLEELEKLASEKRGEGYQRELADTSASVALGMYQRASQLHASMIQKGKLELDYARPGDMQSATLKVVDDNDKMLDIIKILLKPGPPDSRTGAADDNRKAFMSYAVAQRAKNKKAKGIKTPGEVDDAYINTVIPHTQQNYPEVVQAYEMYQRYNRNLLSTARDAGLIDTPTFHRLTDEMDYYGFYREVYENPLVPSIGTKPAGSFELRKFKGSEYGNLVNDPLFVMLHNSQFWVNAIARNLAAQKAFKLTRDMGVARLLAPDEKPDPNRDEEEQVMFFRENGTQKRFAVSDPLLVMAIGSDDRVDMGRFWQLVGLPTQILRESVTRDPTFMVRNLLRDTLSAWVTSGADFTPIISTIKGAAHAYKNGASYQALMGRGIVGSYDLAMRGPEELSKEMQRRAMPSNIITVNGLAGGTAVVRGLWNRLGALSEYSDAATRIAVYDAARAKGLSEAEAAWQAVEILNFSRRGGSHFLSILTKMIPFLNARIQGLDVLWQAGKAGGRYLTGTTTSESQKNLGRKFLVRGSILAALSVLLEMYNDDDEEYQQLDNYIKNANLLIPLKPFGLEGQYLAYPKPFEAGLLFSTFPQQIYKGMTGQASTRENAQLFWNSIGSTLGINPIPQAALPIYEVITNHDFYTGLPLVPEGKSRLSPELQYNSRTSQLAMMLGSIPIWYDFNSGRFEGASPIVIDNLISGYAGPVGTYLATAVGLAMENANVGPERLPRNMSELPVIKSLFVDANSKNPKAVTQAYELFQMVDEANRSFSRLRQTGDVEAVKDYLDENRDILTYKKYVFKLVDGLNKIAARERAIERDSKMTPEEKRQAMQNLREVRIKLTSKVDEINKALGR